MDKQKIRIVDDGPQNMNVPILLARVLLVMIAVVITLLTNWIVPKNQFTPYRLELDSTWSKEPDNQEYLVDINHDSITETLYHRSINKTSSSLEFRQKEGLHVMVKFAENEFVISRYFHFSDINNDKQDELMFLSVIKETVYLHIIGFGLKAKSSYLVERIKVDSISYSNSNLPDVINNDIVTNNSDIFFDLNAGYAIQPRNIYKYSCEDKKLVKTKRNSVVSSKLKLLNYQNKRYLLVQNTRATGNTLSPEMFESFKNSKNKDSSDLYQRFKNLDKVYQYGDFAAYILLYDHKLDFVFEPIGFLGWTNFTKAEFANIGNAPHLVVITNSIEGDTTNKKITICNLQGKILKQRPMQNSYSDVFFDNNKIVFFGNNTLNVYSEMLEPTIEIPEITYACGFYDIENRQEKKFIAFKKNEICILSDDFKVLTSFKIGQEFVPYPEDNGIQLLQIDKKHCFVYNTHMFYYLFSYKKNALALLKYPFYIAIFFLWFGILLLILRFNSMRLVKEKLKLEKTVAERTQELQNKNIELASQKEEIESQSEKIKEQYERLEKLDHFKESLTHALVHDLKNPLSQIMTCASNPAVIHPARKMLRLIMNMLDVERYENTEFRLNKELHCLCNLLEEVKSGQETGLMEKNLELRFLFDDYRVLADKEVLGRVFDNLLANAIRFSPQNQTIDVFAEQIDDDILHISLTNYGEPIPDEVLPYIFDKYRHFGKNIGGHSTGLGLTFCKMAVEAHGGKIGVWNKPEKGCNFWFTIPFASKTVEVERIENDDQDNKSKLPLLETDCEVLKEVAKQVKELKIYEISRFHEILDPLKETSGSTVNEWISQLFCTIYAQNTIEFNRLINLTENGQTKNTDCR